MTMEMNEIALSKILHYIVEEFISCLKSCFDEKVFELNKIFCEIIKRSESIVRDLRSIAIHANAILENSDVLSIKDQINKHIQDLVHSHLQQDFVELIANDDHMNLTESELHNFLHSGALTDVTSLSPFAFNMGLPFNFGSAMMESIEQIGFPEEKRYNFSLSSSQFQNSKTQFEDEVNELRRIMENGFSITDLNTFNVASILKFEGANTVEKSSSSDKQITNLFDSKRNSITATYNSEFDLGIFDGVDFEESSNFLSWEGCLGKFFPDHLFISEATPEEALNNISEKESQAYFSLLNPLDAISEADIVHDIFDLLIGISSETFFYDTNNRKFRMKSGVHLPNLSPECTAKVVSKFIECGNIFYMLHEFSNNFLHLAEGLVFKGLQLGVQQVLSMYEEYIVGVKVNSPSMLFLRTEVVQISEILLTFGAICGIDSEKMIFNEIPKGLGLLSYLHTVAQSHRKKENEVLVAVLLKYTYAPYFSFLNKWLTEGICNDLYGEFQIMEDFNYLEKRDAMYWKFAYTENINDLTRAVPPEIKNYSQGILDCGKSINLLKICCPNLFFLKFLFCNPPPPFAMVFSLPAVNSKLKESIGYLTLKEKAEKACNFESSENSDDSFYLEIQKFVKKGAMMNNVKRRWSLLCAADEANSNICSSYQMNQYFKSQETSKCTEEIKTNMVKWKSLCSSISDSINKDKNFSGKLYKNIGILFSSCGYHEASFKSDSEFLQLNLATPDFSKQLSIVSYSQFSVPNPINLKVYNSLFSTTEMKFFKSIQIEEFSAQESIMKDNVKDNDIGDSQTFLCSQTLNKTTKKGPSKSTTRKSDKNSLCAKSFMDKLTSLLTSEYGDTIEDVCTCIQVTSLQRLIMHNFNAVLGMRIHLVERTIMEYFVKQLRLDTLLSNLRKLYFLQDESFSQSLCEQLFSLVMKCRTPRAFINWTVLNEILQIAISDSNEEDNSFFSSVNVNLISVPEEMPLEGTEFLRLFRLEYEVEWPLNIIVHSTCMQQYLKIFSTLLEIEFLCWLLSRIWRILIITSKELHLDDTPQFREIMFHRFDMEQFVRIIRNSIHQHLQGPLWDYMQKSLSVEESSIDSLESIHLKYLEKVLARCFLTEETHVLHELLTVMLRQIYKFASTVFECKWKKSKTGQYETFEYKRLSSYFDTFKQYQKVFLKRILKETLTKKFGRHWDKDYQDFLDTILETEKNVL